MDYSIFNNWSSSLAYLLGWAITDACVEKPPENARNAVTWELEDEEPLTIIKRIVNSNKKIEHTKRGKYSRLRLCGHEIVQNFIRFGIHPRKTFKTEMIPMPHECLPHFLRGVLDGDGTISMRRGSKSNKEDYIRLTVEIASATEVFPNQIIDTLGYGTYKPNYGEKGHKSHRASFDCSQAVRFLNYVYEKSEGLRLTRKWNQWQAFVASGKTYR